MYIYKNNYVDKTDITIFFGWGKCLTHFSPNSEKLVPSIPARDYSGD
jgi:hypothetical protein